MGGTMTNHILWWLCNYMELGSYNTFEWGLSYCNKFFLFWHYNLDFNSGVRKTKKWNGSKVYFVLVVTSSSRNIEQNIGQTNIHQNLTHPILSLRRQEWLISNINRPRIVIFELKLGCSGLVESCSNGEIRIN